MGDLVRPAAEELKQGFPFRVADRHQRTTMRPADQMTGNSCGKEGSTLPPGVVSLALEVAYQDSANYCLPRLRRSDGDQGPGTRTCSQLALLLATDSPPAVLTGSLLSRGWGHRCPRLVAKGRKRRSTCRLLCFYMPSLRREQKPQGAGVRASGCKYITIP